MKMLCDIYRSGKKPDMYLYVSRDVGLDGVPASLLQQFGKAEPAMTLVLTPDKKLARADIERVLACLKDTGYYLQMPPKAEIYMQSVNLLNDKLTNP